LTWPTAASIAGAALATATQAATETSLILISAEKVQWKGREGWKGEVKVKIKAFYRWIDAHITITVVSSPRADS